MERILLLVLLAQPAWAQAAADDTMIAGAGTQSCANWTEARSEHDEAVDMFLLSWVQGFLSGLNVKSASGDIASIPDTQDLLASMDRYCQAHATATVYEGAMAIYEAGKTR
jgi:hypothetical protein